ncbi:uncharacterized protein PITG_06520 [Phytophthora infestans T30-4]|uniref:Uncharacterized protein n=1 Tax=Phytophthora infestans (strain T30-4) TaxID=403677 RepID=D0N516_PHYIT|nr:uncharacterized protein PITG_06520 [Phytophthora infestans T30-4]EEY69974.1 hypothetical protein PITG_06520 [Phytophthora infestans T30-4]|eukprot:XP_002998621.1 hypothetical protein PITG_06520 [Phytophthora infestans T30-4]
MGKRANYNLLAELADEILPVTSCPDAPCEANLCGVIKPLYNLKQHPRTMKLERALQLKDQCDRELRSICESKRRHYPPHSAFGSHDELQLLEQDRANETVIRDKRELERLMRKLSPAMSLFASTEAEFVHILQACSSCSNRLAFCASCMEKASEFLTGFSSVELLALSACYGCVALSFQLMDNIRAMLYSLGRIL